VAKQRLDDALVEYRRHLESMQLQASTIKTTMSSLNLMHRAIGNVYIDKIDHRCMDLSLIHI
jgi:hypothetical protein